MPCAHLTSDFLCVSSRPGCGHDDFLKLRRFFVLCSSTFKNHRRLWKRTRSLSLQKATQKILTLQSKLTFLLDVCEMRLQRWECEFALLHSGVTRALFAHGREGQVRVSNSLISFAPQCDMIRASGEADSRCFSATSETQGQSC